jgi:hypothetical protein
MRKHEILLQNTFANLFANTKTDVLNIYEYKQESSLYVEVGDENADKPARSF